MMKIYVYVPVVEGRGGMESVVKIMNRHFRDMGHEMIYIFHQPSTKDTSWEADLSKVIYVTRSAYGGLGRFFPNDWIYENVFNLQEVLSGLPKPDVILALHPFNILVARLALAVYPSKKPLLVSWLHTSLLAFNEQERGWFFYADTHLTISKGIERQLKEIGVRNPIATIYNPVEMSDINLVKRSERPSFIYIGRLDPPKRLDILLLALSELKEFDWTLSVYGDFGELFKNERKDFVKMAESLNISDKIIQWRGWVERPYDEIESATAIILPSDREGFPVSIVEAIARGIPAIASDCFTGPNEIIENFNNGYLIPKNEKEVWTQYLRDILTDKLQLPSQEDCVNSVQKFESKNVLLKMNNILEHWVAHSSFSIF